MKHLILPALVLSLVSCSQSTDNPPLSSSLIEYESSIGEVLPIEHASAETAEIPKALQEVTIPEPLVATSELSAGGPPKDGIPAIDQPTFQDAVTASTTVDGQSYGVLIRTQESSKFYPFSVLRWHEIVNDEIDGEVISVTYCPLTGTSKVFSRIVDGRVLDFGTTGKLYESNLVMYDRQTDSYWSQLLGQSLSGEYTSQYLTLFPADVVTFSEARSAYPNLMVLSTNTGFQRDYTQNAYEEYYASDELYFPVSHVDRRAAQKTSVYGVELEGNYKAYDLTALKTQRVLNDTIGGIPVGISIGNDHHIAVTRLDTGTQVVGFTTMWFAWVALHHDTELWLGS